MQRLNTVALSILAIKLSFSLLLSSIVFSSDWLSSSKHLTVNKLEMIIATDKNFASFENLCNFMGNTAPSIIDVL